MTDLWTVLPIMLLLLLAQGFFSGSEIALVSSDKLKLQSRAERGDRRAKLVLKLFRNPESLLATTLIGTNISTMTLTVLGTVTMIEAFGAGGDLYAILLLTPIMLIFGEIVPKSVYQQHADTIASRVAFPLSVIRIVLLPLTLGFAWTGKRIARLVGPAAVVPGAFVTRQRLRLMLESADRAAELPVLDRDRIQRAVRLSDMTVGEAMIPLAKVIGAPDGISMKKLARTGSEAGHRRIPLFEENISNITKVAFWTIWDELAPGFTAQKVTKFTITPHFASSIQRLDDLMPFLLSRADHMAVVVDEFGSCTGIVTAEDLMAILLGSVARGIELGPRAPEKPVHIERLQGDAILVDATTRLAEAEEILDVEMPTREFHTLGGFLTSRLQRIPQINDSVDEYGYRFIVIEANSRTALKIMITPITLE
ncbi:MAG: hemolysin family protein [Proteobacteria bacterium]|nr:hemolysin family protein [Pseudomonadota bacterium]